MPTKSNRSFRFVISGEGEEGAGDWFLRQLKSIWLEAKEATITSNNWVGCNFKPFRGHAFMTSTKNDQLCDPQLLPSAKFNNRSFVWKINKKNLQTRDTFKDPSPPPYYVEVIKVWFLTCLRCHLIFFVLKNTSLLFGRNKPIIKILLKDTSEP